MQINTEFLTRFRTLRALRTVAALNDWDLEGYKLGTKQIWDGVHYTYNIPLDLKLKVELDGDLAGELRYKDGTVYEPHPTVDTEALRASMYAAAADAEPTSAPTTLAIDPNRLVVISEDGLAIVCESFSEFIAQCTECVSIYRVAMK